MASDLWSCNDQDEQLYATEPDEAIERFIDDCNPSAKPTPVTVYGWNRKVVRLSADRMQEDILEPIEDEYGPPDGPMEVPPVITNAIKELCALIEASLTPWQCELSGEVLVYEVDWSDIDNPTWREVTP